MHIEPGVLSSAKILLSYATAAAALGYGAIQLRQEVGSTRKGLDFSSELPKAIALGARAALATVGTLVFFELLPHFAAGPSEVHFIFGTTLFLLLGVGASAMGLAAGLAIQGLLFAPTDLPQYCANLTTLLVPLFAINAMVQHVAGGRRWSELSYRQTLQLSLAYQGGVVGWVAFWVFYGNGVTATTAASIGTFAAAYLPVVIIEPLVDLGALAMAKQLRSPWLNSRLLHSTAA